MIDMKILHLVVVLLCWASSHSNAAVTAREVEHDASNLLVSPTRTLLANSTAPSCGKFPKGFMWGYGGASFQYEGATHEDGRTDSIWDVFCRQGKCKNEQATVASDFYHRYESDIKLLKESGARAFRFSLSWTRLIPGGKRGSKVNSRGVKFYNRVINECIRNGITPVVTIFHWDLPANLEDPNNNNAGWMDPGVVRHFTFFAHVAFKLFGDRVKHWLTVNEPKTFCNIGYRYGSHAPGKKLDRDVYKCGHHALLAHAKTVHMYRTLYKHQKGQISMAINSDWSEPSTPADAAVANVDMEFNLGWFADPIHFGDYSINMKKRLGDKLPAFTPYEKKLLKKSYDFFALNYYTANYVKADPTADSGGSSSKTNAAGQLIGPLSDSSWLTVNPFGFKKILGYLHKRYEGPTVWITENGVDVPGEGKMSWQESAKDDFRVDYYAQHLDNMCQAQKEFGVKIGGYLAWSFLDNFEWAEATTQRFGVVYVDYKNGLTRHRKNSSYFLQKFWEERS